MMNPSEFSPLLHDRGRGPELKSCRITVFDLIPFFLDPNHSDSQMLQQWPISHAELHVMKDYFHANRLEILEMQDGIQAKWQFESERQAQDARVQQLARRAERRRNLLCQFLEDEKQLFGEPLPETPDELRRRWLRFQEMIEEQERLPLSEAVA
jgi:hypothetical protein